MKKITLIIISYLFFSFSLQAQINSKANSIDSTLNELLGKLPEKANYYPIEFSYGLRDFVKSHDEIQILLALQKFEQDENERTKKFILCVWSTIYRKTDDFHLKQQLMENIASFCNTKLFYAQLAKSMYLTPQKYFTPKAKKYVKEALEKYQHQDLILAVAAIEVEGAEELLKKYLNECQPLKCRICWGSREWKIRLALARLGDKESIDFYIKQFKAYDVQQPRFSKISEKIGYIRQPETIELLKELLMSDKSLKPQYFQNGHGVAFYALHQLIQCIEDFPVTYGERGPFYTLEELEIARTWAKNNTPYKIKK